MDDDSIREDVSADTQDQVVEGTEQAETEVIANDPVSRREQRMKDAREKRVEQREADRKSFALMNDPDLSEEEFDAQQVAATEAEAASDAVVGESAEDSGELTTGEEQPGSEPLTDVDVESRSADPAPNGWTTRDDGTRVRQLKVNGELREITEEEYDRLASKELAGDQKLRIANDMAQRVREREDQLRQREAALQAPPPSGVSDEDMQKALDEYHEAVYEGDKDAARSKLMEVMQSGRQSSTPNMDALADEVAIRTRQRIAQEDHQKSVDDGWSSFQKQYPEVVGHQGRLAYADTHLKNVRAENPDWTPAQQILEAGRLTVEELGLKEAEKPTSNVESIGTTAEEREARKRNLKPMPKAGATAHKPPVKQTVAMTPEAKIARMRSARAKAS